MSKTMRAMFCAVSAFGCVLAVGGVARAAILADARVDYREGTTANIGQTSVSVGISDTIGDGSWNYFSSDNINPSLGTTKPLTYRSDTGVSRVLGYGELGSGLGFHLPGVGDERIVPEGTMGPNELSVHAGQPSDAFPFLVLRWTAGPGSAGRIDLDTAFRGAGASMKDWRIYVDGAPRFSETSSSTTVSGEGLAIAAGQNIDFVVGPGTDDFYGDHSYFSATINSHPDGPAPLARLRDDYDAHTPAHNAPSTGLIADTHGDGAWNFFDSVTENPTDPSAGLTPLVYTTTQPHAVVAADSYIDPAQFFVLPAVKNGQLILGANEGTPGLDELALHPGDTARTYNVTRWTAGASEAGAVNLSGTLRDLGAIGDGVTLSVFADGVKLLGSTLVNTNTGIDFDVNVTVAAGSNVDFVVGRNGGFGADHSAMSIEITPTMIAPQGVIAELRADYDAHTPATGQPSTGLIADTQGNGEWNFFDAATANPTDPGNDLTPLIYTTTQPHAVVAADSYVDPAQGSFFLPGVKNGQLILGAAEGVPDSNELGVHPGQSNRTYQVTRWTAGAGEDGEISISGSARDLGVVGNGITLGVFVDGVHEFDSGVIGNFAAAFDFTTTVDVGSNVDFVIGSNGDFGADHSALAVTITQAVSAVPEPSTLVLLALGTLGLIVAGRRRKS